MTNSLFLQGYRDAQCAWLMLPQRPAAADGTPAAGGAASADGLSSPNAAAAARSRKRAKQERSESPPDTEVGAYTDLFSDHFAPL